MLLLAMLGEEETTDLPHILDQQHRRHRPDQLGHAQAQALVHRYASLLHVACPDSLWPYARRCHKHGK